MAEPRHIPQRELRNRITEVLREVEGGAELRVTVHGRPVADLVPVRGVPRTFVPWSEVRAALADLPPDPQLHADVRDAVDDDVPQDAFDRWG